MRLSKGGPLSWQQCDLTLDHGFSGATVFMLWEAGLCTVGSWVTAHLHWHYVSEGVPILTISERFLGASSD